MRSTLEIGVGELLAHKALRLEDLPDVAVELAGAGLDEIAEEAEERKQQPL